MAKQDTILEQYDRCIDLATDLDRCFEQERDHLIALRMTELEQTTAHKAQLIDELVRARQALLQELQNFGQDIAVDHQARTRLGERDLLWSRTWARTEFSARSNQRLLSNSLRNLGTLAENLRDLMGGKARYSKHGTRVESSATGKVLGDRTA